MFKDLSLKKKLLGAFLITAMITAVVGGIGLMRIAESNHAFSHVVAEDVVFLSGTLNLEQMTLQHRRYEKDFFLNIGDAEKQNGYLEKFRKVAAETQEKIKTLSATVPDDADGREEIIKKLTEAGERHAKYNEGFIRISGVVANDPAATPQSANTAMAELKEEIYAFESLTSQLADMAQGYIEGESAQMVDEGRMSQKMIVVFLLVGVAVNVAFGMVIAGMITKPVRMAAEFAETMASGDFRKDIYKTGNDEVGVMLGALGTMSSQLRSMVSDIVGYVDTLASASTELAAISNQLRSGADQTVHQAHAVTASAEQVSTHMTSVSAASEQASTNVNMVATAAEEMTSTISEIAKNTETARVITGDAVTQAGAASDQVDKLGESASQISKVVEAITEISEQVNLLALNATIEAARAGEAGKGFAVVANEIKELARQTATAAISIREQIGAVQESSKSTVEGIGAIESVVGKVHGIVESIAAAIEEQTAVTREIVSNVSQASLGIGEVSSNIAHSSDEVGRISHEIGQVNRSTENISQASVQVNASAMELSRVSEQIKQLVGRFRV